MKIVDACQRRVDDLRKRLITNVVLERQLKEQKLELNRIVKDKKKKESELEIFKSKLTEQVRLRLS